MLKFGKYPLSHPVIFVSPTVIPKKEDTEERRNENLGIFHVKVMKGSGKILCVFFQILPPRKLFHPLLPIRMREKLIFTLCSACAEEINHGPCNHSNQERALVGAWVRNILGRKKSIFFVQVSLELYKALDLGYEIMEAFESWVYQSYAQYEGSGANCSNKLGLFASFTDAFFKLKMEVCIF